MLKYHEIYPQTCDMGSGKSEYIPTEPMSLNEVLKEIKETFHSWGTITILFWDGEIYRKFDYDIYNDKQFYHHLDGWVYNHIVDKVVSYSCFMSSDLTIYLNKQSK